MVILKSRLRRLIKLIGPASAFFIVILLVMLSASAGLGGQTAALRVTARDGSGRPVESAQVRVRSRGEVVCAAPTDARGEASCPRLAPGSYEVAIEKEGFETLSRAGVEIAPGAPLEIAFTLVPRIELKEGVTIEGGAASPVEAGASAPTTELRRDQLYQLASRPTTVADTLPLVPGVSRSPNGEINMSGSGEHRSALIVNAADVTDPATGQFGMTIPVDSVERIEVFKSPFLAQYGRFTAGVVAVETRRGTDEWHFDVHDPLPAFRFRSGRLAGLLNASPRIVFNGPLIKNRLYLSEGIEYRLFKDPVRTLPHPNRETKSESVNSFTQLDYIAAPTHTVTATLHIAPRKVLYSNLNFYDPRPVTPNFSARDYTGTLIDRLALGPHLIESTLAFKRYGSDVWGQGRAGMIMTPTGNAGNYFAEQDRGASRLEWIEQFTPRPLNALGAHNLRFGTIISRTAHHGEFLARPVEITDLEGRLLRRIEFAGGGRYERTDVETSFFAQDNWVLGSRLAFNLGGRFERQRISQAWRIAPRFGFAWTPLPKQQTVVRGGAGVFYDRVPLSVYAFDRFPEQIITTWSPEGALIDGPRRYRNVIGAVRADQFALVRRGEGAGNFAPYSTTWNVEVEHSFSRLLRVRSGYLESRSGGLVILDPQPKEDAGAFVLNGTGRSRYRQFELSARLQWREEEHLFLSYVRSRARGDLNEFNQYLGNFPSPIVRPNLASNLAADLPHRFLAYGLIKFPRRIQFAPMLEYRTGFPFAAVDPYQDYAGQPNSDQTRFPNFYSLDLRLSKDLDVSYKNKKYTVRVSFYGYNVTNHFNPWDVRRNTLDPQFGVFFGRYRRWFKMDFEVFF